ncbi:protein mono-ADP-ribosyltransferase PARP4 isoform X1 [Rissa tridactyla]|uniref:protein mono-ADP-ribosyltransferase PARP4 isoform X1 n=1 Tax=Rissa tridactyla TaxID=75485 RepID=UPI0023BB096E|nr:protein mono-ADP-ribosyltransferase PARP4 isoform X1 [Rissa tridactyla]XP_054079544.1 protein mono-ADP-ribosyltransferase PARP4 isoform X1 [Rissa tridactyla]
MAIFADCVFFVKIKYLPIQDKSRLKACIKENGGVVNFVLNHKSTHVLVDTANVLSCRDLKNIRKYQLPVLCADFIWKSVEKGKLLQIDAFKVNISQDDTSDQGQDVENLSSSEKKNATKKNENNYSNLTVIEDSKRRIEAKVRTLRLHGENYQDTSFFPQDFEVAKYSVLEKVKSKESKDFVVIELQCSQERCKFPFRLYANFSTSDGTKNNKQFVTNTAEEIREKYETFIADLKSQDFLLRETFPPEAESLASTKLQQLLLEEAIHSSAICQEVSDFVELIWAEAIGHLDSLLLESVNNISLNDVSKAEGILLQVKNALNEGAGEVALQEMMMEFYQVIRHKTDIDYKVSKKLLSRKQDLCQLIRDMLNIRETNMSCPNPSSLAKYRALRCKIEAVDSMSSEFLSVEQQVLKNNYNDCPVKILKVYRVGRITETAEFLSSVGNIRSLFHASSVRNFMGILSRGLLMPKVVVEDHGLERTDIGNLGSGIYFSDSVSASIKYSSPSEVDGTRLLAVCDVALGSCLDLYEQDYSLNNAPSGFDSVHGVRKTADISSDFEDDEFVVYKTCQVKIRYVVKFCLAEDQIKQFQPAVGVELEQGNNEPESQCHLQQESYELPNANLSNPVKTGLQDRLGNPVPLEGVYIKARIIDFVAQVVMFQTYTNQNSKPIEAKYVFPLDDKAAVCGFEAFINGKHVIGEVKEKKQAHREYRKAIRQGDGAYLMDQDAPDIFVISVGNLPPNCTVVIKITYITELSFQHGCITFHLPASVSPLQQDKALNENTQDTIKKVCVKQVKPQKNGFSLDMSIEMPSSIERIRSWTHELKIKKTDCKAVIKTVEDSSLDVSGFVLDIWISEVYLPRMWVEKHPNKMSEACMLVFQPEFETAFEEEHQSNEVTILLDCSNSMAGSALHQAKQIALRVLELLGFRQRVNVVKFGTNFTEFSSFSMNVINDLESLKKFVTSATATLGNTDLWKTLRYFNLLFPSQGHRNILLLSDGHIQNESVTFQIVKDNVQHTRLFTCGVGSTANRHMLRSLSQYGAGAFEYFDLKSKYNWERKIQSQVSRMLSPGCSSVSIKWQQFNTGAPEPMQAPAQIQSLFNNERLLVYGFIPHCTQATLSAIINDQELQTVVSTTELQKTTGTVLHKLAARAFINDYEDGILHENETEHEMKKQLLKNMIIQLSLENSIISQFTSFVAVEKRDANETCSADAPDILEIIAQEDVDFLPYMDWGQKLMESDSLFAEEFAFDTVTTFNECFTQVNFNAADFRREKDGAESLQLLLEEVPVSQKSVSPKYTVQDFVNVSELESSICSLKSSFSFDRDTTKEGSSRTRSPSPQELCLPQAAEPFSLFGFKPKPGGGIDLTQQKSLQTPALKKSHVCADAPKPAPPPPLPCSFQTSVKGTKQASSSGVAPMQGFVFGSSAPCAAPMQSSGFGSATPCAAPMQSSGFGSSAPCAAPMQSSGFGSSAPCAAPMQSSGFGSSAPCAAPMQSSFFGSATPCAAPMQNSGFGSSAPCAAPMQSSFFGSATPCAAPMQSSGFGSSAPCAAPMQSSFFGSATPCAAPMQNSGFGSSAPCAAPMQSSFFGSATPRAALMQNSGFGSATPRAAPMQNSSFNSVPCSVAPIRIPVIGSATPAGTNSEKTSIKKQVAPKVPDFQADRKEALQPRCMMKAIRQHDVTPPKEGLTEALKEQPRCSRTRKKARIQQRIELTSVNWKEMFALQNQDGSWNLSLQLGKILKFDADDLINNFLIKKGIQSLGPNGKEKLLQLIATLLVLQFIRCRKELKGIVFKTLMKLDDSTNSSGVHWACESIKKAIEWVRRAERRFPSICYRLELGKDWDSATQKILGIKFI